MKEKILNFKEHCHFYGKKYFFDNKSYLDLFEDVVSETSKFYFLESEQNFGVSNEDPYRFLIILFSHFLIKKRSILISYKEKNYSLNLLRSQVRFDFPEIKSTQNLSKTDYNIDLISTEIVFFTSGSTNTPKGVVHNLLNLKKSADSFINFFDSKSGEIYFLNLPIHHIGGLMLCLRAFFSGGQIITKLFNKSQIDYISLVPTQLETYLLEKNQFLETLKNSKAILVGGAKLLPQTKEKLSSYNIFETYGMTETASFITLNNKPLPNKKLLLDEKNIILVHTNSLFLGYYENNVFTKAKIIIIDNLPYFKTLDLGEFNSNNDIIFSKRNDRIVNSGGEKISLAPIEDLISKIEKIDRYHLTSFKDLKWGESISLLYESEIDLNHIILNQLKNNLHPFSVPKKIIRCPSNTLKVKSNAIKMRHQDYYEIYLKQLINHQYFSNEINQQPLLVIFHGFMEEIKDWIFLKSVLESKFQLLFIDLPGHGSTSSTHFYNLDDILIKLQDLVLSFNTNEVHFLGYSMGGRVALELSKIYKIKSLTLISSGLGLSHLEDCQKRIMSDKILFNEVNDLRNYFDKWYDNPIFKNFKNHINYNNFIETKIQNSNIEEWKKSLDFFSPGLFPLKETNINFLNSANFKINYICGQDDIKYISESKLLNSHKCRVQILENASHNLHKSHPNQLSEVLNSNFNF